MPFNLSQFWLRHRSRDRYMVWDSVSGAESYTLRWGLSSGVYTSGSLSVGNVLKYKLGDLSLPETTTYYIVVVATNSTTSSSASTELSFRGKLPL